MKRWLRRLIYLLIIFAWLLVMSFPTISFILATRGELRLGDSDRRHVRFFLVQEEAAAGVGVEWARPVRQQPGCIRTTVTYLLWYGEGDNVAYCQCYDLLTGDPLPAALRTCEP